MLILAAVRPVFFRGCLGTLTSSPSSLPLLPGSRRRVVGTSKEARKICGEVGMHVGFFPRTAGLSKKKLTLGGLIPADCVDLSGHVPDDWLSDYWLP